MQTDQRQEAAALIRRARVLIADPSRWIQGSAVTAHGWCAFGALMEVGALRRPGWLETDTDRLVQLAMERAVQILEPEQLGESYIAFNDNHAHEDVMLLFKHAIGVLEER